MRRLGLPLVQTVLALLLATPTGAKEDAVLSELHEGDVIELDQADRLRPHLPPEIWPHRDFVFHEGMQLEIGPAFRDYSLRAAGNGRYGRRDWSWHGGGEGQFAYPKRNVLGFSADVAEDLTKTSWNLESTWINDATFADNQSRSLTQEADVYNLTVSVDRPTFINFLNSNRTFFFNSQIFFCYLPDHDSCFDTNGPLTTLATFSVATGYFQDHLLPFWTFVHDFSSASGGIITQLTYRFSDVLSVTFGVLGFYGGAEKNRIPTFPWALFDTQTSFSARARYEGLSAISERDELFLSLRYTF